MKELIKKNKVDHIDFPIGRRLKALRILRGMSLQDLGIAITLSPQQVTRYEKGIDRISSDRLFAFSKILNLPVLYFFSTDEINSDLINFSEKKASELPIEARISKELLDLIRSFCKIKGSILRKKTLVLIREFI